MLLSKTLRLFLDSIGRREEYEHYLQAFYAAGEGCFAVLAPDAASVDQSVELMAFDLRFLLRLELAPLVLLCGDEAASKQDRLAEYDDVVRVRRLAPGAELLNAARLALVEARGHQRIAALSLPELSMEEAVLRLLPDFCRRLHILRAQGGLRDERGQLIQYHWLKGRNAQSPGAEDGQLLQAAAQCLDISPSLHVSVASPLNLLQELFTVKGAGTIIRPGSTILHYTRQADVEAKKLRALLHDAFGRPLSRNAFLRDVSDFYVEERYRGAALLEPHPAGRYLSKFAVGLQARGEGLALELWNAVEQDHPALFWRSRVGNAVNSWYDRNAEGRQRRGEWQVYWRGIEPAHLPSMIDYAAGRPSDFAPPASP